MRIISAALAAALFAGMTFGAVAAPVAGEVKSPSTYELIKKSVKAAKKAGKKTSKTAKKAKKSKGHKGKGAGRCGTGMYYKKGKCMSASDKK